MYIIHISTDLLEKSFLNFRNIFELHYDIVRYILIFK